MGPPGSILQAAKTLPDESLKVKEKIGRKNRREEGGLRISLAGKDRKINVYC